LRYNTAVLHLLWILVALAAVAVVIQFHDWIRVLAAATAAAALFLWVLISVLSPSAPDRTCPSCRGKGLVKIRRGEPGVRCELCGFRDAAMHVSYLDDW
jgi:DNA-directed RNA polymerase subunit RPC12/RpoP